jgi:hypothetical protein
VADRETSSLGTKESEEGGAGRGRREEREERGRRRAEGGRRRVEEGGGWIAKKVGSYLIHINPNHVYNHFIQK